MVKQMKENTIYCAKCDVEMKAGIIDSYEYEIGHPVSDIEAYECPKCGKVFLTEEQAKKVKARTKEVKESTFGFERKVTISGKSLVVGIPNELVSHLKIKQGQKVKIFPLSREGFLIKKL